MMIVAGEGTPLQAVLFGVIWIAWFGAIAVWPRTALRFSQRWHRWNRNEFGTSAEPAESRGHPWEPTDRTVATYRWIGAAGVVFGLWLVAGGIGRR